MPPAIIGGAIAGVGAIGAAVIGSNAAKSAAHTAADAQKEATSHELEIAKAQEQLFRDIYAKNTANFQPYLNSGYGAEAVVNQLLGLKPMSADQFNSGQWYKPGTVDYTKPDQLKVPDPAPAGGSTTPPATGTGTGTTPPATTPWSSMTKLTDAQKAQYDSISSPIQKLAYLATITGAPPPSMSAPAPAAPAPAAPAASAQPSLDSQAQAAIARGANPQAVAARMTLLRNNNPTGTAY